MALRETDLVQLIRLEASKLGCFLFRNNVGKLQDRNGRWVSYGLGVGSSDLIGLTNKGRFLAIEAKTDKGRISPEQQDFIQFVNRNGGIAGIVRSVEDFRNLLLTAEE